jgi:DNA helicase-2/ATP-dependent DNA helicase PcrA
LTELTLDPPDATSGRAGKSKMRDEDYLILSTIHSAKGLEWMYVHILNVVDGSTPPISRRSVWKYTEAVEAAPQPA